MPVPNPQKQKTPSLWRRLLKVPLFFTFWVLLPWLAVEIAMFLLDPWIQNGFFAYDPDMGHRVRPFANGSNRFGFNDREYPVKRSPGTFRLVIIGDSFGWAGGLSDNYTNLLENRFAESIDSPKVEVINAGYPGTHTGEQLAMLKKFGLQYDPDMVVLGFFAGNDFIDAQPYRKRIVVNDVMIDIDKREEIRLLGRPVVFKSRLMMFIEQKWEAYKATREVAQKTGTGSKAESEMGTFTNEVFDAIEMPRLGFCNLDSHANGNYDDRIRYIQESILEMRDVLQAKGIDFKVAIFPDEFQVDEALAESLFEKFGLDRRDYDLACMQRILVEFLGKNGIEHIDLLDRFKKEAETRRLYLPRDTHWNKEGNRLASDILYERLSAVIQPN